MTVRRDNAQEAKANRRLWWAGAAAVVLLVGISFGLATASILTTKDATAALRNATSEIDSQGDRLELRGDTIANLVRQVGDLSAILNRRSPVLDALFCQFRVSNAERLAFDAYVAELLLPNPNLAQVRALQDQWNGARLLLALSTLPGDYACPGLPTA